MVMGQSLIGLPPGEREPLKSRMGAEGIALPVPVIGQDLGPCGEREQLGVEDSSRIVR